jgi:hypothetical protein
MEEDTDRDTPQGPARARREPYEAPKLRRLGSVRELTLSGGSRANDTLGLPGHGRKRGM